MAKPETSCTDLRFRPAPALGPRCVSAMAVHDEAFSDGRLVGRYWSPSGMIYPEMHLTPQWLQGAMSQGPLDVFPLGIDGQELRAGPGGGRQTVITLRRSTRPIQVRVCTRLDGSDWLVRWLEITFPGDKPTAISCGWDVQTA